MKNSPLWLELFKTLADGLIFLPDKPEENAASTLSALWLKAQGAPLSAAKSVDTPLHDLSARQRDELRGFIARRLAGEPLAHITGRQDFMDIEFAVGPQALVPRRETELLARAALAKAKEKSVSVQPLTIIDICTGCGNVALALAAHLKRENIAAKIFGADLSDDAIALARRNASALNIDVEFRVGDLLAPFDLPDFADAVDVLTCNPPYINHAKVDSMPAEIVGHEPRLAFDGGPFGVSILMRLVEAAPRFLAAGGWLVFEIGLGQGRSMIKFLERSGAFSDIQTSCDDVGEIRAIAACRR